MPTNTMPTSMVREADATLRAFWILSLASLKVSVAAAGWAAYSFDFDFDFFVFSLLCGHRTRELFVDLCTQPYACPFPFRRRVPFDRF